MTKTEELENIKKNIKELKIKLNSLRKEKESYFNNVSDCSSEIEELYKKVKEVESNSNLKEINEILDKKKKELEEFDKEISKCSIELEKLEKDKKKDLDKLFEEIEDLKKELKNTKNKEDANSVRKKIEEVKKKFDKNELILKRRERNNLKRKKERVDIKIRRLYKKIRIISKDKKVLYKEIDNVRSKKDDKFGLFKDQKKEYVEIMKQLKVLFTKEEELEKELGIKVRRKQKVPNLSQKRKNAEEKLFKKGQVLTTEDLLLFQMK